MPTVISLVSYQDAERALLKPSDKHVLIKSDDILRITRMFYKNGDLYIFLTGYVQSQDGIFQCYLKSKCNVKVYKRCFNNHYGSSCNCKSYKTFIMPGLRGVNSDKVNITACNKPTDNMQAKKDDCVDYFLKDVNRIHMQTHICEGDYVSFESDVICIDATIQDVLYSSLRVVDVDKLKREIENVVLCYDIETHSDGTRFSNPNIDHIMTMSIVVKRDNIFTKYCLINKRDTIDITQDASDNDELQLDEIIVIKFDHEEDMLKSFFKIIHLLNPDVITDYNGDVFDMPYIMRRCQIHDVIVRLERYDLMPIDIKTEQLRDKYMNTYLTHYFSYYTHIDMYQIICNGESRDLENNQLSTAANVYLNSDKSGLSVPDMLVQYDQNKFRKIIIYNVQDSILPIQLLHKLQVEEYIYTQCKHLYLCVDDYIKNISHQLTVALFYRALVNTRIDERDRVVPDSYFFLKSDLHLITSSGGALDLGKLKRTAIPIQKVPHDAVKLCKANEVIVYTGGKVLAPVPGVYENAAITDFNNLYGTIINTEGVCFSNVFLASDDCVYLDKCYTAIIPKFVRDLISLRSEYKKKRDACEMGSFKYNLYDSYQNAVKRISNSIYGYFGIFFKPLANYITGMGRSKLNDAIDKIEKMSNDTDILKKFNLSRLDLKVIYGDTDSSFIHLNYNSDEMEGRDSGDVIKNIMTEFILPRLNNSWNGYQMALENILPVLILLAKKRYCFINSASRTKFKGWLVKKDMPVFMRKVFRDTVEMYLKKHSLECGLVKLRDDMIMYYKNFSEETIDQYSFSMSYNEKPTGGKKNTEPDSTKKETITIAKHCRQLLVNSGVDFLPGNGDRIPYVLIDIAGNVTQKSFPVKIFNNDEHVMNWSKHVGILKTFINDLILLFGDSEHFAKTFNEICEVYNSQQRHDVQYPVLKMLTAAGKRKYDELNVLYKHSSEFSFSVRKPKNLDVVKLDTIKCDMCGNKRKAIDDGDCSAKKIRCF